VSWELVAGAVALVLALVFGLLWRKDRREGAEARALLGDANEDMEAMRAELNRLGSPIETPSERRASAAAELESRGLPINDTGSTP